MVERVFSKPLAALHIREDMWVCTGRGGIMLRKRRFSFPTRALWLRHLQSELWYLRAPLQRFGKVRWSHYLDHPISFVALVAKFCLHTLSLSLCILCTQMDPVDLEHTIIRMAASTDQPRYPVSLFDMHDTAVYPHVQAFSLVLAHFFQRQYLKCVLAN